MPKNVAPSQLVKEAAQAHKLFCDSWAAHKDSFMEIGRAIVWIESKALHTYIPKPGSRKGYLSLEEYIEKMTGGECGHTKQNDAKRIYLLTQGDTAIPAEVVKQMPKRNQLQVARISKATGGKVSKELVEKATTQPILKFAETAQNAINEVSVPEKRKDPVMDVVLRGIHVRVANEFYELMDDIQRLPAVRDGDRTFNLETKALAAITTSARNWCQDMINQEKAKANREAPFIPEAVDEAPEEVTYSAPDAGERIGLAEAEGRVVTRKTEAHN